MRLTAATNMPKIVTKSRNISGFYVCTELPISSNQPRLTARPVPAPGDECFVRNSVSGVSTSFRMVLGNSTFYNCDVTEFKQFHVTTPVSNYVELLAGSHFSYCVVVPSQWGLFQCACVTRLTIILPTKLNQGERSMI
ncbi:hypothetical protein ATANTOWER_029290 [Ataeniobius toweri]|uniref:Uncharacterized protein n=1 Tax=Ataeniobius toweri TaxID=208326 RepID=A0ABU7C4B7_9TELE|nr:hypothetical protein [Ataeniobius toweri]